MLQQLCLSKIIDITVGIKKETTCEDTLKWLLDTWSILNYLPLPDKNYIYDAVDEKCKSSNIYLTLHKLNPSLTLIVYDEEDERYIDLSRELYETIIDNEFLVEYLANGIETLSFHEGMVGIGVPEHRFLLKTFLPLFKSVKFVRKCKCSHYNQAEITCLYNSLSFSPKLENIQMFYNMIDSSYWKFIFGIECTEVIEANIIFKETEKMYERIKRLQESNAVYMKDLPSEFLQKKRLFIELIKKIVQTSKPSMNEFSTYTQFFHIKMYNYLASIFAFKRKFISYENYKSIFFHDEVFKQITKPLLLNKIERVSCSHLKFCFDNDLLVKGEIILDWNMLYGTDVANFLSNGNLEIIKYLGERKRIQFEMSLDSKNKWASQYLALKLSENPWIYKHISKLLFNEVFGTRENLPLMVQLLDNSPKLQVVMIKMIIFYITSNRDYPPPVVSSIIETIVIDYELCTSVERFYRASQWLFRRIPRIKNLNMVLYNDPLFHECYLPNLQDLMSIHLSFRYKKTLLPDMITSMINLSQNMVHPTTRLTYNCVHSKVNSRVHSILAINGWIQDGSLDIHEVASESVLNKIY